MKDFSTDLKSMSWETYTSYSFAVRGLDAAWRLAAAAGVVHLQASACDSSWNTVSKLSLVHILSWNI